MQRHFQIGLQVFLLEPKATKASVGCILQLWEQRADKVQDVDSYLEIGSLCGMPAGHCSGSAASALAVSLRQKGEEVRFPQAFWRSFLCLTQTPRRMNSRPAAPSGQYLVQKQCFTASDFSLFHSVEDLHEILSASFQLSVQPGQQQCTPFIDAFIYSSIFYQGCI